MTIHNLDILYTIENAVVCHRTLTIRRVDLLRQREKCVHSAVNPYEPPSKISVTSPFPGIVHHHLSGPNKCAHTQTLV